MVRSYSKVQRATSIKSICEMANYQSTDGPVLLAQTSGLGRPMRFNKSPEGIEHR